MAAKIIEELKNDTQRVHRFTDADGNNYGIRVLGRGENLFFQKNDRAFICEIDAVEGFISGKSVAKWDDGKKIANEEKAQVLEMLLHLYKEFYNDDAKLFP